MSPSPTTPDPAPAAARAARGRLSAAALAALLSAVAGCTPHLRHDVAAVQRGVHEIGCTSECQKTKEQCDDNARYQ